MKRLLTLAAAAALAAAPAYAQNAGQTRTEIQAPGTGQVRTRVQEPGQIGGRTAVGTTASRAAAGMAAVNDALFAAAAADSGLSEVSLSQLGAQRATDPELKQFSEKMIQEHTRMNAELAQVAAREGMRIPEAVDVRSAFCAQSLAGLSGEEFDKCYAKAQLVAHMDALAMFEAEAERGADPNIKALAAKGVPHIKEHLKQLKPIAKRYMKEEEEKEGSEHSRIGAPGGQPIR